MNETIKMVHHNPKADQGQRTVFNQETAAVASKYHESFPGYQPTPLAALRNLAASLGIAGMYVKDESFRFGLNAFKGLGGSYCLGKYIAGKLGEDISQVDFDKITSPQTRDQVGEITFVTATDGNHGRGIAWTANMLGQKAVVYMPKGSVEERLHNIRKFGAKAEITDMNYDDTVAFASKCAEENGWVLVQDTAWEGYEEIPTWIMQGYTTLAMEAARQLGEVKPTHIFLQAGVGAMSGALAAFFADYYREAKPVITIVEPNKADCIYQTALADDGKLHVVDGDLHTIMAGLACGVPCTIGWNELNRYAENFASIPDWVAAKGMRILGNPAGDDPRVISGESGASTTGFVCEILQNASLEELKKTIGLDEKSVVLCISTEGDTDKENYRSIVWDGKYPSC
ncbi:MAG: diaminopropionate ammonia-lyase [Eubacterium sp.]|nr:diaminopropionate ammonia-lyase [Eubacterium sp.]